MAPILAPDGSVVDDGTSTNAAPALPLTPPGKMPPLATGPGPVPESPPPAVGPNMPLDPTAASTGLASIDNPAVGPVLGQYIHKDIPGTSGIDVFQPGHRALMKAPGNYQLAPSYGEASTDPLTGQPTIGGGQSKLGKLLSILRGAGAGFAVGAGQPTIGRGFMAADEFANQQAQQNMARQQGALQLAQARQNLAFYPYLQRLGMMKTQQDILKSQAETGKAGAEAGKATAEAGAIPAKTALEQAQAGVAPYKEDPFLGLVNTSKLDANGNPTPVSSAGMVPLTDPREAAILGKQVGDRVPLKNQKIAEDEVRAGTHNVSANGHVYTVDKNQNVLKDWGPANPQVMMQLQMTGGGLGPFTFGGKPTGGGGGGAPGAPGGGGAATPANAPGGWVTDDGRTLNNVPPAIKNEVRQVLQYERDMPTIQARGSQAAAINQWVAELDHNHDATLFQNRNQTLKETQKDASDGQLGSINTALGHLNDLYLAEQALSRNDTPFLHDLASRWGQVTGGSAETLYKFILDKVGPELTNSYIKGGGTEGERGSNENDFALSKGHTQIENNIFEAANLLNSKLASKRNAWDKGFMPYRPQDHFDQRWMTPEAQQILGALGSRSPISQAEAAQKGGNRRPLQFFHQH